MYILSFLAKQELLNTFIGSSIEKVASFLLWISINGFIFMQPIQFFIVFHDLLLTRIMMYICQFPNTKISNSCFICKSSNLEIVCFMFGKSNYFVSIVDFCVAYLLFMKNLPRCRFCFVYRVDLSVVTVVACIFLCHLVYTSVLT